VGKKTTLPPKIPDGVLSSVDWDDVILRITAYTSKRLDWKHPEDAKELVNEAIRIFLDPESKYLWDYRKEPSPLKCLGSIVNGLLRNYFRKKSTSKEISAGDPHVLSGPEPQAPANQEDTLVLSDLFFKALDKVIDLSDGDDVVQDLALLAGEKVFEVDDQVEKTGVKHSLIYEARRRFSDRLEIAVRDLDKGPE